MMEDPKRLAEQGDAFERALLESAQMDIGSAGAESNCLQVLGSASDAAPISHAALGSKSLMLVVGAGVVASAALVVCWLALRDPRPAAPVRANVTVAPREPAVPASGDASLAAPGVQAAKASPPRVTVEAHDDTARRQAPLPARASGRGLAEEVALLQSARHALAASDPAAALIALDRHAREFKSGLLRLEAGVLRVQALLAHGDARAARERAEQFLSAHPEGPHAKRVRNLLETAGRP